MTTQTRADTGMAWAVKQSFLAYVTGLPDGQVLVSDGAALTQSGEFFFPLLQQQRSGGGRQLSFGGEVRFIAHQGMLSVTVSHPTVSIAQDRGLLSTETSSGQSELAVLEPRDPNVSGGIDMWQGVPATLASAAVPMFGATYAAGEPLAPVTIRVAAEL